MALEGVNEWEKRKQKGLMSDESFHLDPSKTDPVEKLLEDLGPTVAFDELMDKLDRNPNDEEIRRQATLLVNRFEDLASRLKGRIQPH